MLLTLVMVYVGQILNSLVDHLALKINLEWLGGVVCKRMVRIGTI